MGGKREQSLGGTKLEEIVRGLSRAQQMARLAHVVTGSDGSFESWSDTLPALVGVAPHALPLDTRGWLSLLHPADREAFRVAAIGAGSAHERREVEYRVPRPGGTEIHIRQLMEPLDSEARGRWFNTLQDVTPEKLAAQKLAAMARRLAMLRENERRDIARELHDRAGQNLSALSMNLGQLRFGAASAPERDASLADCLALVEATGLVIQDVLTELKPPMLASYGVADALQFHAREFTRRTGIEVRVRGAEPALRLHAEVEMALFRIAQAALNNVAQHAQARSVSVVLDRAGVGVRFEVRDDGRGFDAEKALASGRWGLTAMRERAEAIGGRLAIESAPGLGACLVVELPRE